MRHRRHVAKQQRPLLVGLESRLVPQNQRRIAAGRADRAGHEIEHDFILPRRRIQLDAKILRIGHRQHRHLPRLINARRRVVQFPRHPLPAFDLADERGHVVETGRLPAIAKIIQHKRRASVGKRVPKNLQIFRAEILLPSHVGKRFRMSGKRGSILNRRGEILAQWNLAVAFAKLIVEPVHVAERFVDPIVLMGRRRKAKTIGQHDRMIGDVLGGGEIFVDQRRRHREGFGGVGKTFARGAVGGKLARRLKIDARQIANRAIVFGIAQPPQRDVPRIAGPRSGFDIEPASRPFDEPFSLVGGRLAFSLGRHFAGVEHFDQRLPRLQIVPGDIDGNEPLEVQFPFL